jgi:hypothetical protein
MSDRRRRRNDPWDYDLSSLGERADLVELARALGRPVSRCSTSLCSSSKRRLETPDSCCMGICNENRSHRHALQRG